MSVLSSYNPRCVIFCGRVLGRLTFNYAGRHLAEARERTLIGNRGGCKAPQASYSLLGTRGMLKQPARIVKRAWHVVSVLHHVILIGGASNPPTTYCCNCHSFTTYALLVAYNNLLTLCFRTSWISDVWGEIETMSRTHLNAQTRTTSHVCCPW